MAKKPKRPKVKTYMRASIKACRGKKGCSYTSFEKMETNVEVVY